MDAKKRGDHQENFEVPKLWRNPEPKNKAIFGDMAVSENRGTPKSSILIEFSSINHPFWGTTIFGNTHIPV